MDYNLKYILSGIFSIVFIGFLVWMSYVNQMKGFKICNRKRAFVFGDFLTIKTNQHSYYLQVRDDGLQKGSLPTIHFSDLKRQDFLGLLTDKRTF